MRNNNNDQKLKVFVGNLHDRTITADVEDLFKGLAIDDLRMIHDKETGRFKGFCYVAFKDEQSFHKALDMNGVIMMEREIRISVARDKRAKGESNNNNRMGGRYGYDRNNNNRGRQNYYGRDSYRERNEIPNGPPYTAFVGNLNFNAEEKDLTDFFDGLNLAEVRVIKDRDTGESKGHGYVDFKDRESLEKAVSADGAEYMGRKLRIDVAQQKKKSSYGFNSSSGGFYNNRSTRNGQYNNRNTDFAIPTEETEKERKKLVLTSTGSSARESTPATTNSEKEDPFGGAAPRDEKKFLKKMEELKLKESKTESENETAK